MAKTSDPQAVIEKWLERDLSAAATAGQLLPAFEVTDSLRQMSELIAAGRFPILAGPPGIGKTAVIYEFVRQVHAGNGPPGLQDKRFLQFSFLHRISGLNTPAQVASEMEKLVSALVKLDAEVIPFFRDMHVAHDYGLGPQLQSLAFRADGPILAEGTGVDALLEDSPELEQYFVILKLVEPDVDQTGRILQHWSAEQQRSQGWRFTSGALEQALHLTHRYLTRTRQPRKVLDLLGQTRGLKPKSEPVRDRDVIDRFCLNLNVPRELVDPTVRLDLAALEREFRSQVLGQEEAVKAVVRMIGMMKAGLSDIRRPFGVFLFVGPTGVGKTHVAQLLAEYLFGSRDRMIRFNMADHQNERSPLLLFGDPDGYGNAQTRGLLTQRTMGYPFAVLLLDEFEKAHPTVHDRFLQLIDEGCFINGAGETVSCRSTIIIVTSNTGATIYRGAVFGFSTAMDLVQKDREIDRQLEDCFRFEFLNRFDEIVHFHPLSREDIRTIALRELEALRDRTGLKQRKIELEVDESVLDWLAVHGYDPDYGARFLRRAIERHVTTALADTIVRHHLADGARLALEVRHNRVAASAPHRTTEAAPPKQVVTLPVGTTEEVRSLDPASFRQEADALVAGAQEHLEALGGKMEQRSVLLERMNEPDFWDDRDRRRDVLDSYRALDVTIRVEKRYAKPIQRLAELKDQTPANHKEMRRFGRNFEAAAQALHRWRQWLAQEGAQVVWLVVVNSDAFRAAGEWISDLVEMELAWCRHLNLIARPVAYELHEDELTRVVLEVEGPGAASYLAMEQGVHRHYRSHGRDLRARMEVLEKSTGSADHWPPVSRMRRTRRLFNLEVEYRGRIELESRGLVLEFLGDSEETLAHVLHDLQRAWESTAADNQELARVYAEAGGGARDPRSGVVVPRLKDVLKGRLDKFLEAWQTPFNIIVAADVVVAAGDPVPTGKLDAAVRVNATAGLD